MAELTVQYPDDMVLASGKPRHVLEAELKFQLAVRLFEVGWLSLGKAAELAGCPKPRFAEDIGRMKIPTSNLDDEEIQSELHELRGRDRLGEGLMRAVLNEVGEE